jgi:hypothetical protein
VKVSSSPMSEPRMKRRFTLLDFQGLKKRGPSLIATGVRKVSGEAGPENRMLCFYPVVGCLNPLTSQPLAGAFGPGEKLCGSSKLEEGLISVQTGRWSLALGGCFSKASVINPSCFQKASSIELIKSFTSASVILNEGPPPRNRNQGQNS